MKKNKTWTFKQIYRDKETGYFKEFHYTMGIVKDTECGKFRLINLDDMSIWRNWRFETYEIAESFLNKHPHNMK